MLLLAGIPSPPLSPSPPQQRVPRSAVGDSWWSGSEKAGGRGGEKERKVYKVLSHSDIHFTIKKQALADYKSLKIIPNNILLLVNQIYIKGQKG